MQKEKTLQIGAFSFEQIMNKLDWKALDLEA